jgi:hypothetical protein
MSGQFEATDVPAARSARPSAAPSLATPAASSHDSTMSDNQVGHIERAIAKLEGLIDGFKAVPQIAVTMLSVVTAVFGIVLTVEIFVLNSMNSQIRDVGARVDAIPKLLTEEFRAMRVETSAQTSAIANAITAARQFQPQVVVMPAPAPKGPTPP